MLEENLYLNKEAKINFRELTDFVSFHDQRCATSPHVSQRHGSETTARNKWEIRFYFPTHFSVRSEVSIEQQASHRTLWPISISLLAIGNSYTQQFIQHEC